jgi:paired small multidrug resistance pump
MSWIYLIAAGLFEMTGVLMMNEFSKRKNIPTIIGLIVAFGLSFLLLSLAMLQLPMGMAYAIWTGIGASGGAIVGMIFYGESTDWRRIVCIACIISAVVGLKLVG